MATATGVWGNSLDSCVDSWVKYVQENTPIWTMCNRTAGCDKDNIDNVKSIEKIYGRGACANSDYITTREGDRMGNDPSSDWIYQKYFDGCLHNDFKHFNQDARKPKAKSRQRKHHNIFDVNHKGVDFSGFIVHSANKHHHHHRLKVYLDANDNGRFDKKDELIGASKLKNMHSKNGVGGILESGEIGSVEVKFKRKPSMRSADNSVSLAGKDNVTLVGSEVTAMVAGILFYAADESLVSNISPIGILENFGIAE